MAQLDYSDQLTMIKLDYNDKFTTFKLYYSDKLTAINYHATTPHLGRGRPPAEKFRPTQPPLKLLIGQLIALSRSLLQLINRVLFRRRELACA